MKTDEQNLRIGWIGFHMEGLAALQSLLDASIQIEGVITLKPDALAARSGAVDYASALSGRDVPLYRVGNINSEEALKLLRRMDLDIVFVIGWSQILRPETLAAARIGMVGAHASLLPHNRGSAPINWALIRGESSTGNTLIWLSPSVDEGQIIDQTTIPITEYDSCETLYRKVGESNRDIILRLVPRLLAGELPGHPQRRTDEPLLPRRRPADGQIDWNLSSREVYNFVRALTRPYPGAFSTLDGKRWTIWACAFSPKCASARPGEVVGPVYSTVDRACGQIVACGRGCVALLDLESEDGSALRGPALSSQPWTGMRWTDEQPA
jgi:methionyl-tRNA formyltransferase